MLAERPSRARESGMDGLELQPWMLRSDWRDDHRPCVIVDLGTWSADVRLWPLPPVPVVAVGSMHHPASALADVVVEPGFSVGALAAAIARTPLAAAALVQLLRSIETLDPSSALPLESAVFAMLQGGSEHRAWLERYPSAVPAAPGLLRVARMGNRLDLLIDRPLARNAIDRALRDALHDALSLAALDESIAMVRLRAKGRAFSVGADLAEFGTTRDPAVAHAVRMRTLPALALTRGAVLHDVHVQGACVGAGLELAAFAVRLTAAPGAWFQLPEVGMGILPGFGGCVSVTARIGRQRAALLMLSGRRIGSAHALA
ncbi:MAG: enoyl-CoA hydratase/isomerase family protein, partial [Oxalobacteraceae bacterium]